MKGRKPTPTNLKLLAGNPGRRPLDDEPVSPALTLDDEPPSWLHDYGKEFYRDVVKTLVDMGVGTQADRLGIAALAQALAEVRFSTEKMNEFGRVIKNAKGGAERNPYAVHNVQYLSFVRQFVMEYGLTPCARARLTLKATGEKDDSLASFLNRVEKKSG
jgi:P27 family predicted phage terminase small subunit